MFIVVQTKTRGIDCKNTSTVEHHRPRLFANFAKRATTTAAATDYTIVDCDFRVCTIASSLFGSVASDEQRTVKRRNRLSTIQQLEREHRLRRSRVAKSTRVFRFRTNNFADDARPTQDNDCEQEAKTAKFVLDGRRFRFERVDRLDRKHDVVDVDSARFRHRNQLGNEFVERPIPTLVPSQIEFGRLASIKQQSFRTVSPSVANQRHWGRHCSGGCRCRVERLVRVSTTKSEQRTESEDAYTRSTSQQRQQSGDDDGGATSTTVVTAAATAVDNPHKQQSFDDPKVSFFKSQKLKLNFLV